MKETSSSAELLSEKEVAELLSLSVGLLRKWRYAGQGPPWLKLSRSVRYRRSSLLRWVEQQERLNQATVMHTLLAGESLDHRDLCTPGRSGSELSGRRALRQRRC